MSRTRWVQVALALGACASLSGPAAAMPNFARREGVSCAACHTTIPRLNEFGYRFRKAGFRDPAELGKESEVEFGSTFTARIQARYDVKHRSSPKTTSNQLTFHEVTLYPLSGSFGKHYGSLTELSIAGEDFVEIENAFIRYSRGREDSWFSGRLGIFHPFEGYGASDRPYSISRPFLQTQTANQNGSTFFTPWNFDQAGLELACVRKRTTFSGSVFNGLYVTDDEGAFKAFPAAGGELVKPSGFDKSNWKDVQIFVNQVLTDDGSGLSFFYYFGHMDLPIPGTAPDAFAPATSFENDFHRVAVYGSYLVTPKLNVQGAYQLGQDNFYNTTTTKADGTFQSQGLFAEADLPVRDNLTLGGRLDWFDPSKDKDKNDKTGITVFANVPLNDGLQGIAEFQHLQTKRGAVDDLKDDNFQLRVIWIW